MAKWMTKGQLAEYAGAKDGTICKETFLRWLRTRQDELYKRFGVTKTQRALPPSAVKWICEEYDIQLPPHLA